MTDILVEELFGAVGVNLRPAPAQATRTQPQTMPGWKVLAVENGGYALTSLHDPTFVYEIGRTYHVPADEHGAGLYFWPMTLGWSEIFLKYNDYASPGSYCIARVDTAGPFVYHDSGKIAASTMTIKQLVRGWIVEDRYPSGYEKWYKIPGGYVTAPYRIQQSG
jgi:hypothetical protein